MPYSLQFSERSRWIFVLPPLTRWSLLLRWIDRHETMVYRVRDGMLQLWLPSEVGEGWLSVQPQRETELELTLHHAAELRPERVEAFLGEWWDLDRDLSPFYDRFETDPLLAESLRRNRGARIVGFPDLFEALVIGILGQQVNVAFAYRLKQRLTEAFGQAGDWQGETWWRFPSPADLQGAELASLREMQISQRKAEYLLGVAEAMTQERFTKAGLLAQSWQEQLHTLTALRGIGHWTAQYVSLKCLHHPRAFPAGDAGLQNAVKRLLHMERKPTVEELHELAESWQGWEAYATWFLWMSVG